jgi:hypothetical protein
VIESETLDRDGCEGLASAPHVAYERVPVGLAAAAGAPHATVHAPVVHSVGELVVRIAATDRLCERERPPGRACSPLAHGSSARELSVKRWPGTATSRVGQPLQRGRSAASASGSR